MFSDEKITNPEIRESLYKKVFFLLEKKQKIKRNNDNNTLLIEYLMKGILANMKNESYALLSCKILMKLVEQNCFSYQIMNGKSSLEKNNNIFSKYTQKYLSDNNDVLNGFLQNYSRLTNDIMTTFAISLSSFIEKLNNRYRNRVIIKCRNSVSFRNWIRKVAGKVFVLKKFSLLLYYLL